MPLPVIMDHRHNAYIATRTRDFAWGVEVVAHLKDGSAVVEFYERRHVPAAAIRARSGAEAHRALARWCAEWSLPVRPKPARVPRWEGRWPSRTG